MKLKFILKNNLQPILKNVNLNPLLIINKEK